MSGFNKQRLQSLFRRKMPRSQKINSASSKGVKDMSLNFEYKKALIKKCNKCGMLLIGSVKKCPNCGNKKFN